MSKKRFQFIKTISHHKKSAYNSNVLHQTAYLVVNLILFNGTPAGRASDFMTVSTKDLSMDERVSGWCCVCNWAHQCFTVGFLRFPYSVVCTFESLSLFLSPFYILISMYWEMIYRYVKDLSCEPNMYLS